MHHEVKPKSRPIGDDLLEDYDSEKEDTIETNNIKHWTDEKRLKEGQLQVRYGSLVEYKLKANIPNLNCMFEIEELLD